MSNKKSKSKKRGSFVLKSATNNPALLELSEVVVVKNAEDVNTEGILKDTKKSTSVNETDLRHDLKLSISSFKPLPFINQYILLLTRIIIFTLSLYLIYYMCSEFYRIVSAQVHKDQMADFKGYNVVLKFCVKFMWASINAERCMMLIFLGTLLPLLSTCYGFAVASSVSLYTTMVLSGGADELEGEIWAEMLESKRRSKGFLSKRITSCASRLDCVLGHSFTLPVLFFLSLFNFKTVPTTPKYTAVLLILLIVADELMVGKDEIEVEAVVKVLKMYGVTGMLGFSWIFFIR